MTFILQAIKYKGIKPPSEFCSQEIHKASSYLSRLGEENSINRRVGTLGSHLIQTLQWPGQVMDSFISLVKDPLSAPFLIPLASVRTVFPVHAIVCTWLGAPNKNEDALLRHSLHKNSLQGKIITTSYEIFNKILSIVAQTLCLSLVFGPIGAYIASATLAQTCSFYAVYITTNVAMDFTLEKLGMKASIPSIVRLTLAIFATIGIAKAGLVALNPVFVSLIITDIAISSTLFSYLQKPKQQPAPSPLHQ